MKSRLFSNPEPEISDSDLSNLLNSTTADFTSGKWIRYQMNKKCTTIKEINAQNIYLQSNECPSIIKEIKDIQFPQLKVIYFLNNKILSVEHLSRNWMPALQRLSLGGNHFISIKDLRKSYLPNLLWINLQQSSIKDGWSLTQMLLKKFKELMIEVNSNDQLQCHSLGWVTKLQTKKLKQLHIRNQKRIKEAKVLQILKKKENEMIFSVAPSF